uniref:Uncharacterized protein n=1 Tax=Rhizophora mucronata TaxID=61149 RepID=A0A2P2QA38_RHIMU
MIKFAISCRYFGYFYLIFCLCF